MRSLLPELRPRSFFQKVVPVPPNRFRPPAKVGDQVFEHSQNVWLSKIIELNEQLQQMNQPPKDGAPGSSDTPARVSKEDRVLRAWDEMCRTVVCIADSGRAPGAASGKAPDGVKQMLEKKEGLFRMNI
eukprot:5502787-Prymnesium_polylepis.1